MSCDYCDTSYARQETPFCKVYRSALEKIPNPISLSDFIHEIEQFHIKFISFTGGEPMLCADFIEEALPYLKNKTLLLETNGTISEKISDNLLHSIDYWSVDIKLPSVTKADHLELNKVFIQKLSKAKNIILKAVFSEDTVMSEIKEALLITQNIYHRNQKTVLVFQPLTKAMNIRSGKLNYQMMMELIEDYPFEIRIIPQIHKILKIL